MIGHLHSSGVTFGHAFSKVLHEVSPGEGEDESGKHSGALHDRASDNVCSGSYILYCANSDISCTDLEESYLAVSLSVARTGPV